MQLNLNAVDAVDAVKEKDENEDKRDLGLSAVFIASLQLSLDLFTFIPYCILATIGLSARKVKSLRFQVNGIGTMRAMKMTISKTRRRNTWQKAC